MIAEVLGKDEIIAILQNFRPSVSPEEYIAGLQAEYCGDIATIECQENVAEVNGELDESASADECPLCDSADNGDIAEVKRLLDSGANPNAAKYDGWTALMYASFYGHAEIVKMMLSSGANPNAANFYNETALFNASKMIYAKSAEIMKMLLAAGANPNAADKDGWTALMIMAKKRHPEIVKMLLSAGADVNAANTNGDTALYFAEWKRNAETIAILQNFRPSVSPEEYIAGLQAEYCGDIATIECQENYISPEEPAEEIAEEPAKPETKTVCRSFANGINPDNTQWGRIGASEAGFGETEYAAIRAAIKICENDGLTECQTNLEVECEEVAKE